MLISCSRCSDGSMWLPFWLNQIVIATMLPILTNLSVTSSFSVTGIPDSASD